MKKMIAIEKFDLHIKRGEQILKILTLSTESSYIVGRSENCQIAIQEPGLSRQHLLITLADKKLRLRDISSNGSSIAGQDLQKNQDYIIEVDTQIDLAGGLISLYFEIEKYAALLQDTQLVRLPETRGDKTQTVPTTSKNSDIFAKLQKSGLLTIGRSGHCDIVIPSLQVSREHARLRLQGEIITLQDLQTTNGTFVNGVQISGEVQIQITDQICIGSNVFVLAGGKLDLQYAIVANNIEKIYPKGFVGLHRMSIKVPTREFVALMGPSGCGKSTLLKCLNGANPISSGDITIQGLPLNNSNFNTLKKHIGYVPQDDIVHSDLSVEKTLYYAAKLRMASDVSNQEIREKIEQVLKSLNLDVTIIGKNKIKELSGGQRKRISIAVELLNDPTILFLDEPTSPLDPETIEDFLSCIRQLVRQGQTVIMVTHKPSDLNYVDKVIFLAKGGFQTFYGDKNDVLTHFSKTNIIEVYSLMKTPTEGKKWNQHWLEAHPIAANEDRGEKLDPKPDTSIVSQLFWLTVRYANIKVNDNWNLMLLFAQPVIIALLLVFIFQQLQLSVLFMMAISAVWFGVSNASKEIVTELPIYQRERMFNLNIGNYILSKIIVLSTIALMQVLIFVTIIYSTYEIRANDVQLWSYIPNVGFMFALSVSSTIFGLFLSAIFNNTEKVMTFVPIALMPQIMLAGVIAKMDNDLKILLSYLTLGRWGTEGFAHIQDAAAKTAGHWANADLQTPAAVMQYLPEAATSQTGAITLTEQAQGALAQLDFYDEADGYLSLFPENLEGVGIAIAILNALFLAGIYFALKSKDSRFK